MAAGNTWSLPNYAGELFTADELNTPILSAIGGMTDGGMQTQNFEFPVTVEYDLPNPEQPELSEDDTTEAPDPRNIARDQKKNVAQVFHEAINVTYEKISNGARLEGINTAGASNSVEDEVAFQIDQTLNIIARNIEYTIINGEYNVASASDEANKTRGIIKAVDGWGGAAVDAVDDGLEKGMLQDLFREAWEAGCMFEEPVIITGGTQKQKISDIYGYAPESRNVGGLDIQQLETDFGLIGVMPPHRFMDADKIILADLSVVRPVFQPHPEKGNFFYEELAKDGATEKGQIYGKFGLDHGPGWAHGYIENLDT